jgi:hypothetical protein
VTAQTAISSVSFINTLGINTHIDFANYGYQNLATVETAIKYLGVTNLRDSAETATDATTWLQVAQATGAKFDDYIAETSPAGMTTDLGFVQQLAQEGLLNYLEGGNEEDDAYPAALGNTLQITAQFQQQVYATGHALGLPVINMSFGSGWTAANNWQGDYGAVGNLAAYADYANAHTYANPGQLPGDTINRLNGLANLAAASRPVMTTEIGWDETQGFTQTQIADYVLDAALDGIKYGDVKTYFYALFNDGSGNFGLMNSDGTPKPAGTALHDLTTLLADTGANAASFTPGSLNYTLSSSDNTALMEKSDGTFWLSVWNESAVAHSVTVTLGSTATQLTLFDPLAGTSAVQTASNTGSFTFTLSDHPLIVEVAGAASGGGDSGGSGIVPATPDPVVTVPASETVAAGGTLAITGVSISDPWAATNPGSLTLNVTTTGGTVAMKDASGNPVTRSGTGAIQIAGTLAQINADLATLSYTAGAANASVTVDIWDQAGVEATKLIGVTVPGVLPNPVVTVPASETVTAGATAAFAGVSVSDPWAAGNPGTLALNVTATAGAVSMKDASGALVAGSGTGGIHISGTLSQLNADLSTLSYTAGSASASVTVDVWDQAGVEATKAIGVSVTPPTITIPANQSSVTENISNAIIVANAGNHMIFIGGTGDVVTAIGGNELEGRPGQHRQIPQRVGKHRERVDQGRSDRHDEWFGLYSRQAGSLGISVAEHAAGAFNHVMAGVDAGA